MDVKQPAKYCVFRVVRIFGESCQTNQLNHRRPRGSLVSGLAMSFASGFVDRVLSVERFRRRQLAGQHGGRTPGARRKERQQTRGLGRCLVDAFEFTGIHLSALGQVALSCRGEIAVICDKSPAVTDTVIFKTFYRFSALSSCCNRSSMVLRLDCQNAFCFVIQSCT